MAADALSSCDHRKRVATPFLLFRRAKRKTRNGHFPSQKILCWIDLEFDHAWNLEKWEIGE